MSQPQEPSRPFFPFGNPFRMLSPKGSQLSPRLLFLLNSFEETLAERFRKLNPKDKEDILNLTWLKSAMESLCETHTDIKSLITDLELPVTDWDEEWIDVYLDISVKLLDICVAFSSELMRLNQGHLLLKFALHGLKSDTAEQFVKAHASVDRWRQHITSKTPRLEKCSSVLKGLVGSSDLPKVKNSAKGKVLMRAMYGVKVQTVFVCSILTAALSGSSKDLLALNISDSVLWAQAYTDLQAKINGEVQATLANGNVTTLKELGSVDSMVKKLAPMIHDGLHLSGLENFQNALSELGKVAEKLSQGLDLLASKVDGFFKIVLTGRDALLGSLGAGGSVADPRPGA